MMLYVSLFIGGAIGGVLRYATEYMVTGHSQASIVIATLCINIGGCFLLGCLHRALTTRPAFMWLRAGLLTGIIGSYTTYSAFCVDTERLVSAHPGYALMYGLGSLVGGPLFVYIGDRLIAMAAGRKMESAEEVTI